MRAPELAHGGTSNRRSARALLPRLRFPGEDLRARLSSHCAGETVGSCAEDSSRGQEEPAGADGGRSSSSRERWKMPRRQAQPHHDGPGVTAKHDRHWNAIWRVENIAGLSWTGQTKFRVIDDHLSAATTKRDAGPRRSRCAAPPKSRPWSVLHAISSVTTTTSSRGLRIATHNLTSAFEEVWLPASQVPIVTTIGDHSVRNEVGYRELCGQPFGAGHAVPHLCG